MDDGRTHARRVHDHIKRKRLEQRLRLKQEARAQGGPDDMHDEPDRENRILFDCCDDIIREPDAIRGAKEIEARTLHEERRVHDDGDLEAIDDLRRMEKQDFDVI